MRLVHFHRQASGSKHMGTYKSGAAVHTGKLVSQWPILGIRFGVFDS